MTIAGGWEIYLTNGEWCAIKGPLLISAATKTELEQKLDEWYAIKEHSA